MVPHSMTSDTQRNFGRRALSIPITPETRGPPHCLTDHTSLIEFKSDKIMYYEEWNGSCGRYSWITISNSTRRNLETYLPHIHSTHQKKWSSILLMQCT